MCWFIHGAVFGNINAGALKTINAAHECQILQGTKRDVKNAVLYDESEYCITNHCCDCDTDIGNHNPKAAQVIDLADLIAEVGKLQGAEYIYICRTWVNELYENEKAVDISEINLKKFFADFESNTMYVISCRSGY